MKLSDARVGPTGSPTGKPDGVASCASSAARTAASGGWRSPPGARGPHGLSSASEGAPASGGARLLSWVICPPPVLPAWKDRTPYTVVLVECEEGVRTMGNLLGATPDVLRMDMPM